MRGLRCVLARGVAALHFGYLAYLIAGGFLAWRWPKTLFVHVAAAGWAAAIVATPVHCPLTKVQNKLRAGAGLPPLVDGFVDTYVRGRFFPSRAQSLTQRVVAAVVLASWLAIPFSSRRKRQRVHASAVAGFGRAVG